MEDCGVENRPGTGIMLEWQGSGSTSMSALGFCHRKSWMLPARLWAAHRKHQTSTQCLLSRCPLAHVHSRESLLLQHLHFGICDALQTAS